MHIATAGMSWRGPRRRSQLFRQHPIRAVRNVLRRIEQGGLCETHRAQLVLAVRRLFSSSDPWDGPLSAA